MTSGEPRPASAGRPPFKRLRRIDNPLDGGGSLVANGNAMPLSRELLPSEAIHQKLQTLEGWRFDAGRLLKRFEFGDFVTAFGWMTEVALWAEKLNHHPDWTNVYRSVDVALQTHDAGGVTEYDFALALRMDACATSRAHSSS